MDETITLSGIVLADGSLHLSGPLPLPQCEVEVIVRPLVAHSGAAAKHRVSALPRTNYRTDKAGAVKAIGLDTDLHNGFDEYEYGGGD